MAVWIVPTRLRCDTRAIRDGWRLDVSRYCTPTRPQRSNGSMQTTLTWQQGLHFQGQNERGDRVDVNATHGEGGPSAPAPMELLLQAAGACTGMDAVAILKKKRKHIVDFTVTLDAERVESHPKTFSSIAVHYHLVSPDATEADLKRSIELSQENYCPVMAMLRAAGVDITWTMALTSVPADA